MKYAATLELDRSDIRWKLAAGAVEADSGIIRGCTVMKAGVPAAGKFVMINSQGAITLDEKLSVKKLPVFTDEKTLETLMAAARIAGKRIKVREDHDDAIGARAGFSDNFVKTDGPDGRVSTDIKLFSSYRNRSVMLETARETPDQIGLSIDFDPSYEIAGERALLRVDVLHGVDIVDEGAVTPDGLFSSRGVDTTRNGINPANLATTPTEDPAMASPTLEEIMSAVSTLKTQIDGCMSALSKMSAAPAAPADGLAAVNAENAKLAAALKEQAEQLKVVVAGQAQFKKERALLGFRGSDADRVKLAAGSAEDIERASAETKTYLQLVDEAVTASAGKLSRVDAHSVVQKTADGKTAYAEHLLAKGVTNRDQLSKARAA